MGLDCGIRSRLARDSLATRSRLFRASQGYARTRRSRDRTRSIYAIAREFLRSLASPAILREPPRAIANHRDPPLSPATLRDPSRSIAILRDPPRSTRSFAILRDPTRSFAILRDPSRSFAILRVSRSYASRDLASVHIPGPAQELVIASYRAENRPGETSRLVPGGHPFRWTHTSRPPSPFAEK